MKRVVVLCLAVMLLTACGAFFSNHSGVAKNSVRSQGCIGAPPECLGGE